MFHLVSYKWICRTQYITPIGLFYKNWDFTWRVSDCEELVGENGFRKLRSCTPRGYNSATFLKFVTIGRLKVFYQCQLP